LAKGRIAHTFLIVERHLDRFSRLAQFNRVTETQNAISATQRVAREHCIRVMRPNEGVDWLSSLIELSFHVPLDTKQVISETFFFKANLLAWYGKKTKPNTTKARIHQSKEMYCNT